MAAKKDTPKDHDRWANTGIKITKKPTQKPTQNKKVKKGK